MFNFLWKQPKILHGIMHINYPVLHTKRTNPNQSFKHKFCIVLPWFFFPSFSNDALNLSLPFPWFPGPVETFWKDIYLVQRFGFAKHLGCPAHQWSLTTASTGSGNSRAWKTATGLRSGLGMMILALDFVGFMDPMNQKIRFEDSQ